MNLFDAAMASASIAATVLIARMLATN